MLAAQATSSGSGLVVFLPLILMMAGLWFLMSRQGRARRQKSQQVQAQLRPGVEVMTTAGLFGEVVFVDDSTVTLEVSPGVTNRYLRAAIAEVVAPGTAMDDDDTQDVREVDASRSDAVD